MNKILSGGSIKVSKKRTITGLEYRAAKNSDKVKMIKALYDYAGDMAKEEMLKMMKVPDEVLQGDEDKKLVWYNGKVQGE